MMPMFMVDLHDYVEEVLQVGQAELTTRGLAHDLEFLEGRPAYSRWNVNVECYDSRQYMTFGIY